MDVMSVSSWREVLRLFRDLGVRSEEWPEYEEDVDLPVEQILLRSEHLADQLRTLMLPGSDEYYWARRICTYVRMGEVFYFCK